MLAVGTFPLVAGLAVLLHLLLEAVQVGGEGSNELLVVILGGDAKVVLELADAGGDHLDEISGGEDAELLLRFGGLVSRRPEGLFKHKF